MKTDEEYNLVLARVAELEQGESEEVLRLRAEVEEHKETMRGWLRMLRFAEGERERFWSDALNWRQRCKAAEADLHELRAKAGMATGADIPVAQFGARALEMLGACTALDDVFAQGLEQLARDSGLLAPALRRDVVNGQ